MNFDEYLQTVDLDVLEAAIREERIRRKRLVEMAEAEAKAARLAKRTATFTLIHYDIKLTVEAEPEDTLITTIQPMVEAAKLVSHFEVRTPGGILLELYRKNGELLKYDSEDFRDGSRFFVSGYKA